MGGPIFQGILTLSLIVSATAYNNFVKSDADFTNSPSRQNFTTLVNVNTNLPLEPLTTLVAPPQAVDTEVAEEVVETTPWDYEVRNETSLESEEDENSTDTTDYGYDMETSTGLDNESTIKPDNKYKTDVEHSDATSKSEEHDTGSRLMHYAGWSALIVGIVSVMFVIGYLSRTMWKRVSHLSD